MNEIREQATATYPSLKDRVVLISGGATGIGEAIVERFCEQGAKVTFLDVDLKASESLVNRLGKSYGNAPRFISCDLRDIDALRAAVSEVEEQDGAVRTLVNNAARDDRHKIEEVTPEYFDDRIAVNLKHQFFATQAVAEKMAAAGGGTIVNMGSVTWMIGQGGMPIYSASKSAIVGLTRSLARDLGPKNIRVNSILPGWIMTQRQIDKWLTDEGEAQLMEHQCLKRHLVPDEIAKMVLFFASDDSGICTNQNYVADGGWV
jgi:NAD(P)-dependent dehydrogenase (short-subunit alcohol dehydrogenase family)